MAARITPSTFSEVVVLRKDPVWSNEAAVEVSKRAGRLAEMAIHELLQDRLFVMHLLDALPKCCSCGVGWVSQYAFLLVDLGEEEKVYGVCDDCPIPEKVLRVQVLPHARALRELIRRRRVWDTPVDSFRGGADFGSSSEEEEIPSSRRSGSFARIHVVGDGVGEEAAGVNNGRQGRSEGR